MEEGLILNKSDIMRKPDATSRRVIATIALVLKTVSKENTLNRL